MAKNSQAVKLADTDFATCSVAQKADFRFSLKVTIYFWPQFVPASCRSATKWDATTESANASSEKSDSGACPRPMFQCEQKKVCKTIWTQPPAVARCAFAVKLPDGRGTCGQAKIYSFSDEPPYSKEITAKNTKVDRRCAIAIRRFAQTLTIVHNSLFFMIYFSVSNFKISL